ncbi:hypothetical protein VTL71DRAFT_9177 [Oculimacula yallundae]|uniref:Uncharacterized protein n=1 Tax=Oculimacula yallundae TaxID=86028 RepID=A0ABR4BSA9_9HELO
MAYQQHHAWYVFPVWGHVTSANALIANMLQSNPALVVTYVTHSLVGKKIEANFAQYPELPLHRLRLLTFGDANIAANVGKNTIAEGIAEVSRHWLSTLEAACSADQAWPKPTALILDQNGSLQTLPQAKSIVGPECKTFMYWAGSGARLYSFLAPSSDGGFSDWEEVVARFHGDEVLRRGRTEEDIIEQVCTAKNGSDAYNGTVIKIPGLKEMHDYEREFGEVPVQSGMASVLRETTSLARSTDGIISASSMTLEGETLLACQKYAQVYPIGVQVAPRGWSSGLEIQDEELRSFLERYGSNEVALISFGSLVFPSNKNTFAALTSTLIRTNQPFILVLGGMFAAHCIDASEIPRIRNSGIGFVCDKWVDQQALLQHPSIGWLIAHGGFNSTVESLVQGVPLIGWPLARGDNAVNVAMVATRDRPVAFEVMQIRTGDAKATARRGGAEITGTEESIKREFDDIFAMAKGEEGKLRRENARVLAAELRVERDGRAQDVIDSLARI